MPYIFKNVADLTTNSKLSNDNKGTGDGDSTIVPFLLLFISFLITTVMLLTVALIQRCCCSSGMELDDDLNDVNLQYDESEEAENDSEALLTLTPDQQETYFQAKEYIKLNGFAKMNLANWQLDLIKEKGVHAWEFTASSDNQQFVNIDNKTEITFNNNNNGFSIQSNLPIPNTKDVHYVEFKIFDIPQSSIDNNIIISIGFATYPYPSFVLPGRYLHSIAYDSNGDRRHNNPFPINSSKLGHGIFPPLEEGDVVGIGLRKLSKTVFFTRNGKKLSESKIGGHIKFPKSIQLFPTIGTTNPCRVDVNFGQMGYVFIEANVKKWALGPLRGTELPPPLYTKFNHDVLLDTTDVEDSEPPDFEDIVLSGLNRQAEFTEDERGDDEFTLATIDHPPTYNHLIEDEISEAMRESVGGINSTSNDS